MPKDHPFFALSSSYINKGQLVPDQEVLSLVASYIQGKKDTFAFSSHILLLDGLPRNPSQAKILMDLIDLKATIHLKISSQEALLSRLLLRAEKEGRADDASQKVIIERLNTYNRETLPALELLKGQCETHIEVDGCQKPAAVSSQILEPLGEILAP